MYVYGLIYDKENLVFFIGKTKDPRNILQEALDQASKLVSLKDKFIIAIRGKISIAILYKGEDYQSKWVDITLKYFKTNDYIRRRYIKDFLYKENFRELKGSKYNFIDSYAKIFDRSKNKKHILNTLRDNGVSKLTFKKFYKNKYGRDMEI